MERRKGRKNNNLDVSISTAYAEYSLCTRMIGNEELHVTMRCCESLEKPGAVFVLLIGLPYCPKTSLRYIDGLPGKTWRQPLPRLEPLVESLTQESDTPKVRYLVVNPHTNKWT
jgi:hypothetical protein